MNEKMLFDKVKKYLIQKYICHTRLEERYSVYK
jgi:hypothetical protein